jgi:membrane-bound lytic murein transglycosylase B
VPYRLNAEVMNWARDVAQRRDLDIAWVEKAIGEARFVPQVQRLMRPGSGSFQKNWAVYRSRFIDPVRIGAGVRFWQNNRAALERAEAQYGVPASIIVGIIGVETIYGRDMGTFRVIDALTTLAFDFPTQHPRAATRQAFFRDELEKFLTLKSRTGLDPLAFRGSYAGAMGLPQFMPSSWTQYAVDFDGDGKVDLFNTPADAIGSVANYFKGYGWTTGMPTHFEARFSAGSATQTPALPELLGPDILPSFAAADLSAKGLALDAAAAAHSGKLALVELKNGGNAETYVLGTQNFYVITRYNWSAYYAMAVIDLADEVERAIKKN